MTLTKDDLQTMLQETEDRLGKKIDSLEARVDKRLMEQNVSLERRLMAESIKIAREFRKQLSDLKPSMTKIVRETFELVYEDHPTKQETESQMDDLRDEIDRRFAEQDSRIQHLEQGQQTT